MNKLATPQVDIVLGTFNGEKHLREQIDSILAQTYSNWHLLIGDDMSSDHTMAILDAVQKEYPDNISVYPSQERLGVIRNFSRLLEMTTAEYIMFCDQDDYWFPEKIEKSICKMKELESRWGKEVPLLVYTDMKIADEDLSVIDESYRKLHKINPERSGKLNAILMQNVSMGCAMIFNQNLINLALPIPSEGIFHDYWLVLVASACGYVGYLDEPTMLYRQHESNLVGSKNINFNSFMNTTFKDPLSQLKMEKNIVKHAMRAYVLYKRFQNSLNDQQKEMLESFIELKYQPILKELYWRWKYNFFKHGFWPNVGLLLATIRMGRADPSYRLRI